jgi:solute carrier family 25 phosphate transporter 23/24/25/41
MGIAPYVAINFTAFNQLKTHFKVDRNTTKYFDIVNLSLGAMAGGIAATITYPTDVVRRRMQLQGTKILGDAHYTSSYDCVVKTFKAEGMRGLYKGLTACYLKVIPSMAISFMTFERLRVLLDFQPPKKKISISG